jgi:hypothetical protein
MAKILWTPDPTVEMLTNPGANISRPSVLVSGLPPPLLALWLEQHAWAVLIPLVVFSNGNGGEAAHLAANHERVHTGGSGNTVTVRLDGDAPFASLHGPAAMVDGVDAARGALERRSAIDRTFHAARLVATAAGLGVPWEVGDASDGVIGVGLAVAWGRAVVVARRGPGPLFAAACQRHGVSSVGTMHALAL